MCVCLKPSVVLLSYLPISKICTPELWHENERVSLKNLLVQYQDIFSRNDKDIGHTDIIQHTIDTGTYHLETKSLLQLQKSL